jgi:hypothetical protein
MALPKNEILDRIKKNWRKIERFGVRRIGVFGSCVREEAMESSDVDLLVEFEEDRKNFENFIGLAYFLEDLLGKRVDLLTPESISPHIRPFVEKEVVYAEI